MTEPAPHTAMPSAPHTRIGTSAPSRAPDGLAHMLGLALPGPGRSGGPPSARAPGTSGDGGASTERPGPEARQSFSPPRQLAGRPA